MLPFGPMFSVGMAEPIGNMLNAHASGLCSSEALGFGDSWQRIEDRLRRFTEHYQRIMFSCVQNGSDRMENMDQSGKKMHFTNPSYFTNPYNITKEWNQFQRVYGGHCPPRLMDNRVPIPHSSPEETVWIPEHSLFTTNLTDSLMQSKRPDPEDTVRHSSCVNLSKTPNFQQHDFAGKLENGSFDSLKRTMEYSLIALGQERSHISEINKATDLHAHYNEVSEKTWPTEITKETMTIQTEREMNLSQWNQLMQVFMSNSANYTPAVLPFSWNPSAILSNPNQTITPSTTTPGFAIPSQLSNSLYNASLETTETEQTKTKTSRLQASGRGYKFAKYLNPPTTTAGVTKPPVAKQKSSSFSIPNLLAKTPSPTLNRSNSSSGSDNRKQASPTKVISIPTPERHNCKLCTRTYSTQTGLIRHEAHKHNTVIWRTNKTAATKNPHSSSSDSANTTEFRNMCGSSKARSKLTQAPKEVNCSPPSLFSVTTLNTRLIDNQSPYHCDRPFCCHVCTKIYYSMSALKMHVRTHTLPCKCSLCGKAFSRMWLLNGHLRTHTGEKPFACVVCARAFADRSNLRAHMQTHSEVKRYRCPRCAKTFSRMGLLTKHQSSTCGLVLNGSMVDRHSETQTPTTSGETLAVDSDASTSPHSSPNIIGRSPHKTCGFEDQKYG
ncbi:hypothetical protein EG68_04316 [Paragonimus skrjabini miyazakii]|uniref:C2H2-type domain-containing protein n=1 Tax=Paragonimus skrjabini miyazakii TaxID=59628 RepID=A0A8S9YY23_9TREM|nr:hypothetical protein EG68_04316 [Paragonimus skrjabini miyazakii]